MENKIYIGDSVYIERNSRQEIILTTENGVQISNIIIMDLPVFENLLNAVKRWKEDAKENKGG